jgi:hypothetical protein
MLYTRDGCRGYLLPGNKENELWPGLLEKETGRWHLLNNTEERKRQLWQSRIRMEACEYLNVVTRCKRRWGEGRRRFSSSRWSQRNTQWNPEKPWSSQFYGISRKTIAVKEPLKPR